MEHVNAVEILCKKVKIDSGVPAFVADASGAHGIVLGREKTLAYRILRAHEAVVCQAVACQADHLKISDTIFVDAQANLAKFP